MDSTAAVSQIWEVEQGGYPYGGIAGSISWRAALA